MEQLQIILKKIKQADAILIDASNGLSITEGIHLFADNTAWKKNFGDFREKYGLRCILQAMENNWQSDSTLSEMRQRNGNSYDWFTFSSYE